MLALMTSLSLTLAVPLDVQKPNAPPLPNRLVAGNVWLVEIFIDIDGVAHLDGQKLDAEALKLALAAEFERYLRETADRTPVPKAQVIIRADQRRAENKYEPIRVFKMAEAAGFQLADPGLRRQAERRGHWRMDVYMAKNGAITIDNTTYLVASVSRVHSLLQTEYERFKKERMTDPNREWKFELRFHVHRQAQDIDAMYPKLWRYAEQLGYQCIDVEWQRNLDPLGDKAGPLAQDQPDDAMPSWANRVLLALAASFVVSLLTLGLYLAKTDKRQRTRVAP